jgi:aminoglycoside phosphotransferase (APT) family kinase protein
VTVEESAKVGLLAERLLIVLRRVTGEPALAYDGPPLALAGGFWAELVSFRLQNAPEGWRGPLVARVMPDAMTAAKETVFQAEVAAQGFPTPTVHTSGGPHEGVNGRAFMVMDLAAGRQLLAGLDGLAAVAKLPSLVRRLPATLAEVLARLHRLDPVPVHGRLEADGVARPGIESMLASLHDTAGRLGRADLADAATWLRDHPPAPEPTVICHGDMHPFNVLVDDTGAVTVLDWSAALFAPATYDLGFTSLVLAEPPLLVPGSLKWFVRAAGRALSRRFVRVYEGRAGQRVDRSSLAWHQAVVCLRALVEAAGWVAAGTIDERVGHPWVIAGDAFAARLQVLTGVPVAAR